MKEKTSPAKEGRAEAAAADSAPCSASHCHSRHQRGDASSALTPSSSAELDSSPRIGAVVAAPRHAGHERPSELESNLSSGQVSSIIGAAGLVPQLMAEQRQCSSEVRERHGSEPRRRSSRASDASRQRRASKEHAADVEAVQALLFSGLVTPARRAGGATAGALGGGSHADRPGAHLSKMLKALLLSPGAERSSTASQHVAASRESLRRLSQLSELSQITSLREQLQDLYRGREQ